MVSSSDVESAGAWAFASVVFMRIYRKKRRTYSVVCPAADNTRAKVLRRNFRRMFEKLDIHTRELSFKEMITLANATTSTKRMYETKEFESQGQTEKLRDPTNKVPSSNLGGKEKPSDVKIGNSSIYCGEEDW